MAFWCPVVPAVLPRQHRRGRGFHRQQPRRISTISNFHDRPIENREREGGLGEAPRSAGVPSVAGGARCQAGPVCPNLHKSPLSFANTATHGRNLCELNLMRRGKREKISPLLEFHPVCWQVGLRLLLALQGLRLDTITGFPAFLRAIMLNLIYLNKIAGARD